MKKMIEITGTFSILPHHVTAVRYVDEDSCNIFVTGQSATEGFLVPRSAEDVIEDINEALKLESPKEDHRHVQR